MFNQIFQRLREALDRRKKKNFTELPSGIKTDLTRYLNPGEEILFTLLNFRAIYKAPTLMDSNTFFNSWFILTNRRIIVAKNSSSFKKFRDIPHNTIDQIHYETGALDSRLRIHSPGTVDIIEFLRESKMYREDLEIRVNRAIEEAKKAEKHTEASDMIFCPQCGSKIPKESKFCSECGKGVKSLP
jgi:DNA-directed RNA polymerase subunit RPC12/RpoP